MNKFWTAKDIAKMIDHSLLNPIMTVKDITDGCEIARDYGVATVCVKPSELALAAAALEGSGVLPTTVIGFPHGSNKTSVKVFEAREAIADGAREIDMVINIGRLLSGDFVYVEDDVRAVVEAAHAENVIVKVILENCFLTDDLKRTACEICERAGADFVKTSTGYGSGGATIEDLTLMREACTPKVRIKAAGGVRTLDRALEVRAAGAERFGATATKAIMDEAANRERARNRAPWRLVWNKIVRYPGGREIDRFRGIEPALDDNRPEAWVGSDTRTYAARLGGDPNDGCAECELPDGTRLYLFEAIEADPDAVLGPAHIARNGPRLGFLVKLLDAERQLSLQAHPTRPYAKEHFGSDYGKEESWYIIGGRGDAAEPPYIYIGFKEGVTREMFEDGFDAQDAAALEACCHKVRVKAGDAFFVAAGAPHAVGGGCFLLEVQEPSDVGVGWRKLRSGSDAEQEAHKQRTLGCYIYEGAGEAENLARRKIPPRVVRRGDWGVEELIIGQGQTDYYSFTRLTAVNETALISTGAPQIAIVLEGSGVLTCAGASSLIRRGDEFFLPYAADAVKVKPLNAEERVTLMLCNPGQVKYEME